MTAFEHSGTRPVALSLEKRLGAETLVGDDLATFERAAARLSAAERPQVVIPPLKTKASAIKKLGRKKYGPEGLTDINRASVLVHKLTDVPEAFRKLRALVDENPGWSLHAVDDGFSRASASGYRDLSVLLRAPNGNVSELQFHVDPMWEAKFRGGGHKLYEELRQFEVLAKTRPLTMAEEARRAELEQASLKLYGAAWRRTLSP